MEKVVLTKEQFEAIKWLQGEEYTFDDILNGHSYWSAENTACLNALKVSEMAKILYTGNYEIEKPKFQPGDKVVRKDGTRFMDGKLILKILGGIENCEDYPDYRHATPEEIYWLETLGREKVADFRIGDIYIDEEHREELLGRESHLGLAEEWYEDGDFKGIYPTESFKPFPEEESK